MLKAIWKCDDENKLISVGGKGTHVSCNPLPAIPLITRPKPLQFITTETQILHWKTSGFGKCTAGEYEQIFHFLEGQKSHLNYALSRVDLARLLRVHPIIHPPCLRFGQQDQKCWTFVWKP